jgi:hypothetical protein
MIDFARWFVRDIDKVSANPSRLDSESKRYFIGKSLESALIKQKNSWFTKSWPV